MGSIIRTGVIKKFFKACLLGVFCFICLPVIVFADDATEPIPQDNITVGPILSYFSYSEFDQSGFLLMEETGVLYGAFLDYTSSSNKTGVMLNVRIEYAQGGLNYDGQLQDGTPLSASTEDKLIKLRGLLLSEMKEGVHLYTGAGYHYWNNIIKSSAGYERERNWLYIPIGLRWVNIKKTIQAHIEYDYFLTGSAISHLSDVDPGFNDPVNNQRKGVGLQFNIETIKGFNEKSLMGGGIYLELWSINESDISSVTYNGTLIAYGVEPKNTIVTLGLYVKF